MGVQVVRCEVGGFLLWRLPYAGGGPGCSSGYCTATDLSPERPTGCDVADHVPGSANPCGAHATCVVNGESHTCVPSVRSIFAVNCVERAVALLWCGGCDWRRTHQAYSRQVRASRISYVRACPCSANRNAKVRAVACEARVTSKAVVAPVVAFLINQVVSVSLYSSGPVDF
jgi:hypothetical protein